LHSAPQVFQRLTTCSYRAFKQYAQNARAFYDEPAQLKFFAHRIQCKPPEKRVLVEQAKLYLDLKVDGRELLSFNTTYLTDPDPQIRSIYKQLIARISAAIESFFKRLDKDPQP
jgi:hypothetical protein